MVETAEFPVAWLLARLERRFDSVAAQRGLELRLVGSGAVIRSDAALLAQILDHVVSNAVNYTTVGRVLVGCRRSGNNLRIEVWDTGPGVPGNEGGAGVKGDATTLAGGIGLSVVDRLAGLLRHTVRLVAIAGLGTCFSITVPLARAPGSLGRTERRDGTRPVVLVIEDEEQVLAGLSLLLKAWQFDVVAAASEDEAIARLRYHRQPPDGIIADYRLRQGRTGTDAVNRIRALYRTPIPTIIITGDTTAPRLYGAEARGLVVLQKPVAAPCLQSILVQTLRAGV